MASNLKEENDNNTCSQVELNKMLATTKRNPKIDFNKSDLLKLLSYMEGELQARDVVIAALKSERIKQLINITHYKPPSLNDPHAALFRDNLVSAGNIASRQSSIAAASSEQEARSYPSQQLEYLQKTISSQRQTVHTITGLLKQSKEKYCQALQDLEEERRRSASNDPITTAERVQLRQVVFEELEIEKNTRKKAEDELKKLQKTLDAERARQKQMVLFLLSERKQIIMKYNEERKRSEDLAQILSEEKQRVDTIAEGLEEESKKSLRMEAELEKQMQTFDAERKLLKAAKEKEEKRIKELEHEILQIRSEYDNLKKSLLGNVGQLDDASGISPMMSSVAKVVQPTATVSSVPVSGPTTGVARSISTGQTLRQTATMPETASGFATTKAAPRKMPSTPAMQPNSVPASTAAPVNLATINPKPSVSLPQQQALQKKSPAMPPLGRGVPPPIPPNKPVIPPKRDASSSRITPAGSATGTTGKEKDEAAIVGDIATTENDLGQNYQQIACGGNSGK
ncbi:CTTNBP2 N-terminal-like protein [Phlebotomus papatasi]|uniref:CTTNBP2 N-terminal-like protein n=1 Tax=Phlebotomus papatasi TaxID=29031 RepID=UPI002483A001|nr:CTTNBP2 N-terminal-like protein [Phlebotomus papatasi]